MKQFVLLLSSCMLLMAFAPPLQAEEPDSLLNHNGQRLFLSGMNLAWMNFANDLATFDEETFTQQMMDLAQAGGNTVRWWLHTNGRHSPQFDDDGWVTGIDPQELANLERALDIAYEQGVLVMPCLWSFDMMQDNAPESNWPRNRALLEDPDRTQAYIDNALIPMVEAVKGHPGIIAWEILNEPEGMISGYGWTTEKIQFEYVQQFVNMTAGAIRRTDPDAKISNGSWNIRVLSDVDSWHNYYTDERLIEAGGDPDGYLDFYMVHYYDEHFPFTESPFHNHVSTWQLDKPVVIGEFSSHGLLIRTPNMNTEDMFEFAISNGYAGALSWTMTGHDENGGLPESTPALLHLQENYPDVINLQLDPDFAYPPHVEAHLEQLWIGQQDDDTIIAIADLNEIFGSRIEDITFTFTIADTLNDDLLIPYVEDDTLKLQLKANQSGSTRVLVVATDQNNKSVSSSMNVWVYNPNSDDFLLLRRGYASSTEGDGNIEGYALDGDPSTRWSSLYNHDEWFAVEMEQERTIQRIMLHWEAAYGRTYNIQVSMDGEEWTTVYHEPYGSGGWDRILIDPVEAKYLRMKGIERGTEWGYSLWAFEAYADRGDNSPPEFTGSFSSTTATANEEYRATIPLSIVTDPDIGERLYFSVSLADSDGLPTWLSFNDTTRVLHGTPTNENIGDEYNLMITVTDMEGESDELLFTLTVIEGETTVKPMDKQADSFFVLFPNPTTQNLNVRVNQALTNTHLNVYNAIGQVVVSKAMGSVSRGIHQVDVSNLETGIYYLQITSTDFSETQRFIKH